MSRKTSRRRKQWSGQLDEVGHFPAERIAGLSIQCRKCDNQVILAGRNLGVDDEVWFDHGTLSGAMFEAGPDDDPMARYAFLCGRCGTGDQQLTRARLENESSAHLVACREKNTPATAKLRL